MPALAEVAVRQASVAFQLDLDYSLETLPSVDRILMTFAADGSDVRAEPMFLVRGVRRGVMIRPQPRMTWGLHAVSAPSPVVIQPGGAVHDPVVTCLTRVEQGAAGSVTCVTCFGQQHRTSGRYAVGG